MKMGAFSPLSSLRRKIDPLRLMALVRGTENAQFTPAGVLKFPLRAARGPAEILDEIKGMLTELSPEEAPRQSGSGNERARPAITERLELSGKRQRP